MSKQGGLIEDNGYNNSKPYGTTNTDGSEGDKGLAIRASKQFDGDSAEDSKFEGMKSHQVCSAKQIESSGHD